MNMTLPPISLWARSHRSLSRFAWLAVLLSAQPTLSADTVGKEPGRVVAVVNGEPVPVETIEITLERMHGSAAAASRGVPDLDRLVDRVVNDVLLAQEARAMGMHEETSIREKVEEYRLELAVKKLESVEIREKSQPTDEEVKRLFDDQYQRVTFRVVTAYEEADATQLRARLDAGEDIIELAGEASVDPYRRRGGLVDDIERIDLLPGIASLIFSLEPDQVGGPVRTNLGWSVVQVERFDSPTEERFAQVQSSVAKLVRQTKASSLRRDLGARLEKEHSVVVSEDAVASIEPKRLDDGRLIPEAPDPPEELARIDSTLTLDSGEYVLELLSRWKGIRNEAAARAAAPIVFRSLIDEKLLLAEAISRGYHELDVVDRMVHARETDLLIPMYLEEIVAGDIEISEEDKLQYYEEHRDEFHRPPRVRLSQITMGSLEEAERIAALLRNGTDVTWLARRESQDRYADAGGDRGWYTPQPGTQDFNSKLFDAEVGTVLDPFGAGQDWIVLVLVDRDEQGIYEFEEVSGNVRESLHQQEFHKTLGTYLETLRDRSEIEIDQEVLAGLRITGAKELPSGKGDEHGHDG